MLFYRKAAARVSETVESRLLYRRQAASKRDKFVRMMVLYLSGKPRTSLHAGGKVKKRWRAESKRERKRERK